MSDSDEMADEVIAWLRSLKLGAAHHAAELIESLLRGRAAAEAAKERAEADAAHYRAVLDDMGWDR